MLKLTSSVLVQCSIEMHLVLLVADLNDVYVQQLFDNATESMQCRFIIIFLLVCEIFHLHNKHP